MRDLPRWIIGDCPHTGREIAVFLGSDACPPFAVEFMPRRDPACLIALDAVEGIGNLEFLADLSYDDNAMDLLHSQIDGLIAAWCAANNAAHVDHAETLREILDNIEDKNAGQN